MSGKPVVNPDDQELILRVQTAFWTKLQRMDVLEDKSPYVLLAKQVLVQAAELGWTLDDLEDGCKRFQAAEQFGDRIEIAKFFKQAAETLHPYQWVLDQVGASMAKFSDFDGYAVDLSTKIMWRRHDGKRLESLKLIVWQGTPVEKVIPVEASVFDRGTGITHEIPLIKKNPPLPQGKSFKDYAMLATENIDLKAELGKALREVERLSGEVTNLRRTLNSAERVKEMEAKWAREEKEGISI